jgi:hypothetical protein
MRKQTTAQKVRRYMAKHPAAQPKQIAEALGVKLEYVYVLRSVDKKKAKPEKTLVEMIKEAQDARKDLPITMIEPKPDPVNHPAHYKVGGIETIDFIEAKGLGYNLGNVIKYITRADHKSNTYEDLCKARWYLNREISKHLGVNNQ